MSRPPPPGGRADWPLWTGRDPTEVARYVVPDVVARHVRIPAVSAGPLSVRLGAVWERLRAVGIGYAFERFATGAGGQWIRSPSEVLVAPCTATCLDLAVVLAGACLHAGIRSAIVLLDGVESGVAGHALVAVLLGRSWPASVGPGFDESTVDDFRAEVQSGWDGPPRAVLALDPVGVAHPVGAAAPGLDAALAEAVAAGAAYLASPRYAVRAVVPADATSPPYVPAPVPDVLPLRTPYREPGTAESALRLLRAEFRVTPFQARDELTVLSDLCEQTLTGTRTRVLVITGRGGAGKTRLALELAERARRDGWYGGVLREQTRAGATLNWLAQITAPLLVVVDYADARAATAAEVLSVVARRPRPAVVVLTARERSGEWLTTITDALESDGHPHRLEHIDLPDAHPRPAEMYGRTYRAVATTEKAPPRLPLPERGTRWTTLDLVLLGWLAATGRGPLPGTAGALYDDVLRHERRYWTTTLRHQTGSALRLTDVLAEAAACLTLLTPTPVAAADALMAVDRLADDELRGEVAQALRTCLDPGPGEYLAIRPDPIGDHHLLTVLDGRPALLERCLQVGQTLPDDAVGEGVRTAIAVLTRAGRGAAPSAAVHLEALLRTEPGRWPLVAGIAYSLGGAARDVLERLAAAPDTPLPLDDVAAALPFEAAGLWRLGLVVDERRLRDARSRPDPQAVVADLLLAVSQRRADAGDRSGAVAAAEEATELLRRLASTDDAVAPGLTMALNDLSVRQADAGERSAAVAAAEEAVERYRRHVQADPEAFAAALAGALLNLSNRRALAGRYTEALAVVEEAVERYRALAAIDPSFTSSLASALNNLSNCRSELEDRSGALTAIEEAVRLRRALVTDDDAADVDDLASALNNLSSARYSLGDHRGALTAITEAVGRYADLAERNRAAFAPDLAMASNNMALCLSAIGDPVAAVAPMARAVDLYRELAAEDPQAFVPDLATSLSNLSNRHAEVGDHVAALRAAAEAVALQRDLMADAPDVFAEDLAASLNNLSGCRAATGDLDGALAAAEESRDLYRELAAEQPQVYGVGLAAALNTLALRRSAVGDRLGALGAIEESVALRRRLAEDDPGAHGRDLALALSNMAHRLFVLGEPAAALAATEEAVGRYRGLMAAGDVGPRDLAAALTNLSVLRSETGDRTGGLAALEEAVAHYRALSGDTAAAVAPDLAAAVNNLSVQRLDIGDTDTALVAAEEAVALYRTLVQDNPTGLPDLAMALTNLAYGKLRSGESREALTAAEEAVRLYRDAATTHPAAHLPSLARSLTNLSVLRTENGDPAGAFAANEESVELLREVVVEVPAAFPDLAKALNNLAIDLLGRADADAARAAGEEGTDILRRLHADQPHAYAADLVGSLTNLAQARNAAGARTDAVRAIEEAVRLAVQLVAVDPGTHLSDLATAACVMADLDPPSATRVWTTAADAIRSAACRAELWAEAADWYAPHDRAEAVACLRRAVTDTDADADTGAGACDPDYLTSRARERIRAVAQSFSPAPPDLPAWAVRPIPAADDELARSWRAVPSWPAAETLLRATAAVVEGPSIAESLAVLRHLRPGDRAVARLGELVAAVARDGLEALLTREGERHRIEQLVRDWASTGAAADSMTFLRVHRDELLRPEVAAALLARADDPVALWQTAVLELAAARPVEVVQEIVTEVAAAGDHALAALDRADLGTLRAITVANPEVTSLPGVGFLLRAVLMIDAGLADEAVDVVEAGARASSPVQRRARIVNLRRWATADPRRADPLRPLVDALRQAGPPDPTSAP